ncbi:MAG: copper chaperone PCu(A)C [Burkholderiaceae bacterium]|nr:copper chaperone PCu(A)C [Burkholderiaceae bacterium]
MNTERIVSSRRALPFARLAASLFAVTLATAAAAEVRVDEPWARATVAGQQTSGAFMILTSSTDARLVGVQSPAAGVAEIHEMAMENNVMRMRAIDGLALPAGKPVELRPGGYHLMLLDLKKPLEAGQSVPLTLTVEDAQGKRERIDVQAQIRPLGGGQGARMHGH